MGVMSGYRQVSLYIKPDVYERVGHVARILNVPVYKFIDAALEAAIISSTTAEQRKALDTLTKLSGGKKHEHDGSDDGSTNTRTEKRSRSRKKRRSR